MKGVMSSGRKRDNKSHRCLIPKRSQEAPEDGIQEIEVMETKMPNSRSTSSNSPLPRYVERMEKHTAVEKGSVVHHTGLCPERANDIWEHIWRSRVKVHVHGNKGRKSPSKKVQKDVGKNGKGETREKWGKEKNKLLLRYSGRS
ncbi:hypothetical protein TNCV_803921 [Trichonephila clavipes]|nr:hypothetical protein TNCV_803921 [Trichonephila clavipes]